MVKIRDWQQNRTTWIRVLEESTGKSLEDWNRRIKREGLSVISRNRCEYFSHNLC